MSPNHPRTARLRRAIVACLIVGAAVACGPAVATPSAPAASPSAVATASPSPGSSGPVSSSAAGQTVEVDPTLLDILPDEVGGTPLEPAGETAAEVAVDPAIAEPVEALAMALAVSSGSSTDQDIAIASVVRLRPDVFTTGFFRGWRTSYDEAACAQAGGVAGNAEAEIGGRTVFIGSCVNGAFTYHVRYGEDVIVSVTSVGERRFGEEVMSNLAD